MPSAQYLQRGTPLLFADAAQTPAATLTLTGLAASAGQVSALYDRGAGATVYLWEWAFHWQLNGTNIVGTTVEIYAFWSDGTLHDGGITPNSSFATDKRNNAKLAGLAVTDQTTTSVTMYASGVIQIPTRYFAMGVWNATALAFVTSTSVHGLIMTPLYYEAQ